MPPAVVFCIAAVMFYLVLGWTWPVWIAGGALIVYVLEICW